MLAMGKYQSHLSQIFFRRSHFDGALCGLWQTATTLDRPKTEGPGTVQLSLLGGPTKMSLTSGNSSN